MEALPRRNLIRVHANEMQVVRLSSMINAISSLISPSGGVVWHVHAFRNRKHWKHFLFPVSNWLDEWRPDSNGLLLIGPSAGWCLQDSFLGRFSNIHALDIDPLAGKIFRVLHRRLITEGRVELSWQAGNAFIDLEQLLWKYHSHAILFCNFLGQHGLHQPVEGLVARDFDKLKSLLRRRIWASFHDRLSGYWRSTLPIPGQFSLAKAMDTQALANRVGGECTWTDHLTEGILPQGNPRLMIPWRIRPEMLHWIEAGYGAVD